MEDGLKHVLSFSVNPNASPKPEKSSNILGFLTSNSGLRKRSTSQPRASTINGSSLQQRPSLETEKANANTGIQQVSGLKKRASSGDNMLRKNLWASRSKVADSSEKENAEMKVNTDTETKNNGGSNIEQTEKGSGNVDNCNAEDMVSGFLYDMLQKEVISLRKFCEAKDSSLNAKDEEIKVKLLVKLSLSLSPSPPFIV